ncbi:MAG: hypothetical protein HKN05_15640 [Rhizobiales bacterium]|nr:hypothetical protein [Hyphomicrobiales bacterium]
MTVNIRLLTLATVSAGALAMAAFTVPANAEHRGGWHGGGGYHQGGMKHHRRMGHWFMNRYDANEDGKVTQEEIDKNRSDRHGKYDSNGDGKLSLEEFQGLWLEAFRRRMVRAFQRFDVDGDANVTLDEYTKPLSKIVERRDRNGDGALSRADRRHGKHHRKHHRRYGDDDHGQGDGRGNKSEQ